MTGILTMAVCSGLIQIQHYHHTPHCEYYRVTRGSKQKLNHILPSFKSLNGVVSHCSAELARKSHNYLSVLLGRGMLGMGQRISTMPSILNLRSPGPHSLTPLARTDPTRSARSDPGLGRGVPPPCSLHQIQKPETSERLTYNVIIDIEKYFKLNQLLILNLLSMSENFQRSFVRKLVHHRSLVRAAGRLPRFSHLLSLASPELAYPCGRPDTAPGVNSSIMVLHI